METPEGAPTTTDAAHEGMEPPQDPPQDAAPDLPPPPEAPATDEAEGDAAPERESSMGPDTPSPEALAQSGRRVSTEGSPPPIAPQAPPD